MRLDVRRHDRSSLRLIVEIARELLGGYVGGIQRCFPPDKDRYLYDFGDGWRHQVSVEQVEPMKEPEGYAYVTDGDRACPPEDCGGAGGYQEFLDELAAKPKSKTVKEFLTWAGHDFKPERFDRHAANATLLRMAWNRWGER